MKMCEYQRKKIGDLSARFFRFNPGEDQGQCEPSVTGSVRVVQCPLETLEQTVPLIINGDIRNWRYDHVSGKLVRRR